MIDMIWAIAISGLACKLSSIYLCKGVKCIHTPLENYFSWFKFFEWYVSCKVLDDLVPYNFQEIADQTQCIAGEMCKDIFSVNSLILLLRSFL